MEEIRVKPTDAEVLDKSKQTLKVLKQIYKPNKKLFSYAKIKMINCLVSAFDKSTNYKYICLGSVIRKNQKALLNKYFGMGLSSEILINNFTNVISDYKNIHINKVNNLLLSECSDDDDISDIFIMEEDKASDIQPKKIIVCFNLVSDTSSNDAETE